MGNNRVTTNNRLLVIDDEPDIRAFHCDAAEEMGFTVAEAGNRDEFTAAYSRFKPTVIILDLAMPHADGVELLRELGERRCTAPILIASGSDARVLATAQRVGRGYGLNIPEVLCKPVPIAELEQALAAHFIEPAGAQCEDLKQAIETGNLEMHYQPKVGLRHGDPCPITGGEALVRWRHPERGLVGAEEILAVAQQNGLMEVLTAGVLDQVTRQLGEWQRAGVKVPISVNLSASSLDDLTLPDRISDLLAAQDVSPRLLHIEITEQAAMADITKASDILTRLRLKDISVSLDDFGSGFSSLVEIYRLPLSELKFDQSLASELDQSEDARTVMRALIALAHMLELPVCVEGVETPTTLAFLQSVNCDLVQGYFIARPLPAGEFIEFVSNWSGVAARGGNAPGSAAQSTLVQLHQGAATLAG